MAVTADEWMPLLETPAIRNWPAARLKTLVLAPSLVFGAVGGLAWYAMTHALVAAALGALAGSTGLVIGLAALAGRPPQVSVCRAGLQLRQRWQVRRVRWEDISWAGDCEQPMTRLNEGVPHWISIAVMSTAGEELETIIPVVEEPTQFARVLQSIHERVHALRLEATRANLAQMGEADFGVVRLRQNALVARRWDGWQECPLAPWHQPGTAAETRIELADALLKNPIVLLTLLKDSGLRVDVERSTSGTVRAIVIRSTGA